MEQQKIRIKLKAFDHKLIDKSTKEILETVTKTGAKVVGPIPLPVKKKGLQSLYLLIKTKMLEINTRLEHIKDYSILLTPLSKLLMLLMRLDIAAGVDVKITLKLKCLV